jgi:hypothetical protein
MEREEVVMKKSEIVLGGHYSNGKEGRGHSVRKVIDEGPQYKLYSAVTDTDCIRYRVIEGRGKGREGNMTRAAFAAWAKERVD